MERTGNDGPTKKSKKRKYSPTTDTKDSKYQKVVEAKKASKPESLSASSSHGRKETIITSRTAAAVRVTTCMPGPQTHTSPTVARTRSNFTAQSEPEVPTPAASHGIGVQAARVKQLPTMSSSRGTSTFADGTRVIYSRTDADQTEAVIANKGNAKPKKKSANKMPPLVYFDLETTDLDVRTESITQIAALSSDKSFDVYVKPTCRIGQWARENTHLNFDNEKQRMYYRGQKVHSKTPPNALNDFMSYLREFGEPVILVAHFCHKFDAVILYYQLKKYNMWDEFVGLVKGFADTLPMFQRVHPRMSNHTLKTLASNFLEVDSYATHNAIDDTRILKTLVENEGNINYLVNNCCQECSEIQK